MEMKNYPKVTQFFKKSNVDALEGQDFLYVYKKDTSKRTRVAALLVLIAILSHKIGWSQVSPYQLSPKWMLGRQAGLSFPSSGAPTVLTGNPNNDAGQEATTTICDTSGQIALYSNNSRINDRNNTQLQTVNSASGQSSTDGAVAVPDPASPIDQYYLFTGNDITGGSAQGINWYRIRRNTSTGTLTTLSGPNNVATGSQVMEALCAGNDGNGGYWVVTHAQSGTNEYWAWKITSSGVSSVVKSASSTAGGGSAGSVKLSRCQDRIVFYSWAGGAEVYAWNKASGTTGALLWSNSNVGGHSGFGYGCEFSPNGNMAYFTNLNNNKLYHLDIAANTLTDISGGGSSNNQAEMGTLQLGPDDKLYVTNVSNFAIPTYIGVVNNPNNAAASCNYNRTGFTLNSGPGFYPSIYRGIANIAWLNPNTPSIDTSKASCVFQFAPRFKTYFNKDITSSLVTWSFGDGTTGSGYNIGHTYTTPGKYTVTMTFTDAACNQTWGPVTTTVNPSCPIPTPIELLYWQVSLQESAVATFQWAFAASFSPGQVEIEKQIGSRTPTSLAVWENSYAPTSYTAHLTGEGSAPVYFRLKYTRTNGSIGYSAWKAASATVEMQTPVPNPSLQTFTTSPYPEELEATIVTQQGQEVDTFSIPKNTPYTFGEDLAQGIYILRMTSAQSQTFYKLLKL